MEPTLPHALILAGGRSSRMGAAKALLPFGSGTLLSQIIGRLKPQAAGIALNAPADFPGPPDLRRVPDTLPGQPGPLAGVLAGLLDLASRTSSTGHLLTVPSDAPFLPADLTEKFLEARQEDAIVIAASAGRDHPVFGLWPVAVAADLQAWLADPHNRRMYAFLHRHRVVTVDWTFIETSREPLDPFMNVNTPQDLEKARLVLEEGQ